MTFFSFMFWRIFTPPFTGANSCDSEWTRMSEALGENLCVQYYQCFGRSSFTWVYISWAVCENTRQHIFFIVWWVHVMDRRVTSSSVWEFLWFYFLATVFCETKASWPFPHFWSSWKNVWPILCAQIIWWKCLISSSSFTFWWWFHLASPALDAKALSKGSFPQMFRRLEL